MTIMAEILGLEASRYLECVELFRSLDCDPFPPKQACRCRSCGRSTAWPVRTCKACVGEGVWRG